MATIRQSYLRFTTKRSLFFLNKANPDLVVKPMVLNSVNPGDKTRNEVYSIKMPTSESSKLETRKILTQEITLTSKAPLKILELLEASINSGKIDDCLISECCKYLKNKGKDLDQGPNVVALNRYFDTMRNLSRDASVDPVSRMKLLEIIELRARNWRTNEEIENYYAEKKKAPVNKSPEIHQKITVKSTPPASPVKVTEKSTNESSSAFAQTISIDNEVLVISSSLPQLTQKAKEVLEEYFQRHKADFSFTCSDSKSEKNQKSGYNNGFNGSPAATTSNFFSRPSKDTNISSRKIVYDREFLLRCANSELSKVQPHDIKIAVNQIPDIARKH